ncbi:MAG: M81 family metallopeptidase [Kiritimatiellae bacterium]|nr:M81 family metallopeptidase [Kiritimatiellia bacterium]
MRIAIAGLLHETNTFADGLTPYAAFELKGANPGLLKDREILQTLRGVSMCTGGHIAVAEKFGVELVPLIWTMAQPSGTVRHEAYIRLRTELLDKLRQALPVHGVLLELHGAMVTDQCEDVEGDLLQQVRSLVGPRVPVIANLDLHANITSRMAREATTLIGYDTYPHVDFIERGEEAANLMAAILKGAVKPVVAYRQIDLMIGPPRQCTLQGPMADAFKLVHELERQAGIITITLAGGFPFADIRDAGVAVVVTANADEALARRTADELADYIWSRRQDFRVSLTPVREAIDYALRAKHGPVLLADGSDNPGGGAPCDGTVMLAELVRANVPSAVVAIIADPEAVARAHQVGAGHQATLVVGGKTDARHGSSLTLTGEVRWVGEKEYVNKGPMMTGMRVSMGRAAVFVVNNVEIILAENRFQPFDCEALRCLGIEPRERLLVGLKSAVHFRAGYQTMAAKIFELDTPGIHSPNLSLYTYRRLRRPIYPLDEIPASHCPIRA